MYFLLILIPFALGKLIEITPVNNEYGFTIFKMELKPIIESYTKVLHIIDLKKYAEILDTLETNIQTLNLTDREDYDLLNRELILAKDSLNTIIPHTHKNSRRKRGVLNFGGKILNFLVGTMDSDDAAEIYNHLNNLDQNTKQITEQVNKQVIINNDLIKNLNEVVDHVNKQQVKLNDYLNNITENTNKIISITEKSKFILRIYADINLINRQLEKLIDIILMSRLNILPHDILTDQEKIKYNISLSNLPYIKTNILNIDETLIFTISIPRFTHESYYKALVIPFPNDNREELDNNIEEVIIQNDKIYVNDDKTILKRSLKLHKNECIRNVFMPSNVCKLRINNVSTIEEMIEGIIITKNLQITEIKQNCISQKLLIKNNNIIKFSNCKVQIEEFVFKNEIENYTNSVIIPITHVNFTKMIDKLSLEKLNIENIKNREQIKYIEFKHNVTTGSSIISLLLLIIIGLIIYKINCCKGKRRNVNVTKIKMIKTPKLDPFAGTANSLGGGGVI